MAVVVVAQVMRYVAALAVGAVLAWGAQGWRMDAQVQASQAALETLKREHAESLARAAASALNTYALMESAKDAAIQSAAARAAQNQADAAGLRRQLDSLHHDLAAVPTRIAAASCAAVDEYAAAATVVFEQCSERYAALAAAADGHASDVRLMREAWPTSLR